MSVKSPLDLIPDQRCLLLEVSRCSLLRQFKSSPQKNQQKSFLFATNPQNHNGRMQKVTGCQKKAPIWMLLKNRYQEKEPSGLDQIFAIITWQIFVSRIRKGLRDSLKEVPSLGQADRIIYIFRIPWCFQNPALDCIGSLLLSQFQVFHHKKSKVATATLDGVSQFRLGDKKLTTRKQTELNISERKKKKASQAQLILQKH